MIDILTLELTDRCNIRCRHCIASHEPGHGDSMDFTLIDEAVSAASELNIPMVSASGGETFLVPNHLRYFLECTQDKQVLNHVVTNAFWAVDSNIAGNIMEDLYQHGLNGISVSYDQFHQEFITTATVRNAINAALDNNIEVDVKVVATKDKKTLDILREVSTWGVPVSVNPMFFVGRAKKLEKRQIYYTDPLSETREIYGIEGCQSANKPFIQTNGNVIMCCGGLPDADLLSIYSGFPAILGNAKADSVRTCLERLDNKIIRLIERLGPIELMRYITKDTSGAVDPSITNVNFESMCEYCVYLLSKPQFHNILNELDENTPMEATPRDSFYDVEWDDIEEWANIPRHWVPRHLK